MMEVENRIDDCIFCGSECFICPNCGGSIGKDNGLGVITDKNGYLLFCHSTCFEKWNKKILDDPDIFEKTYEKVGESENDN